MRDAASQPGRRERAKLDKERRIREAALALFREKGFEHATTKEIAERADIAAGTLFLYVPDKRKLLFLVFRERIAATLAKAGATLPAKGETADRMMHYFEALFRLYRGDVPLARHFVREQAFAEPSTEGDPQLPAFLLQLAELVEAGKAAGEVAPETDAFFLARLAFSLYFGALLGWFNGFASEKDARADLRRALALLLAGAQAR